MSQPEPKPNEPSKLKMLLSGGEEDSPLVKLQHSLDGVPPVQRNVTAPAADVPPTYAPVPTRTAVRAKQRKLQFLPAFWTVASVMSITVNIVLLIVLALVLQNMGAVGVTATALPDHLLSGLYDNFVKMDQAHIRTNIPVRKEIPVNFQLNVSGPTSVRLSENVTIQGATVTVFTGGLNITNARANIVLPRDTILPVIIENLVVPVDQKVLAELDVAVDIPLNQTELHEPFVGLREVVEPFYCLLNECPKP